ncbi:MAG: N-acetylmuramoyl-L-alanine amidase [Clostridium sp.]|uniref:N-acetylmuramoyl-L-alanine amidase n=1 Tax=Clostridium sp. TaxID=1506 RepID=UPI00291599DB|nr:N-acetylmuramoyl-L-alanine amidase [Clostridium sp.]MDU7947777.1 N-acetylmuramoyl-L-alanine amidase [Clostridium sp.]
MKIAVRGGHNFLATGCSGLIDETTEDRKVKDSVIKYLNQLGHTVLDVTPGNMDTNSDLVYGVSRANNWGADLFISIHFNKAYNSYNGAIGTETWVYSESDNYNDEEYAKRIVDSIGALGFKNRGVKTSIDLYELKHTTMPSVIVEVCFVEATEDVALYKKLGSDKIGQVIAEAIANKKIEVKVEYDMKKLVTYYGDADLFGAVMVAQKNRCPLMKVSDYKASGLKVEEVIQIGGKPEDANRYVSFKNAAKLV